MGSGVDRRSFLGVLTGLPVALLLGKDGAASGRAAVEIDTFFVAGYQFHGGPTVQEGLRKGLELSAAREPGNAHDEWAIALFAQGVQVGYVPRRRNAIPARLLDGGFRIRFEVAEVDPQAPTWERVLVRELVER